LATFTARSTEFAMPIPSAARDPVSGASTPITTVVPEKLGIDPLPEEPEDIQALRLKQLTTSRAARRRKA
jgi:hypothetical protein